MITPFNDEYFMKQAFQEAQKAFEIGEVPVGAVVVCKDQVIARAHNLTEQLTDVTAHAEMQAITAASNFLGGKYLKDCVLYVTLEPCTMCGGALSSGPAKERQLALQSSGSRLASSLVRRTGSTLGSR